jgi:hypothetical protein
LTHGDKSVELAAKMQEIAVATYQAGAHHGEMANHIVCGLAAYLDEAGQPLQVDRGAYTRFHTVAFPLDVSQWLGAEIGKALGRKVTIRFMRDTEAAAAAYAGLRPVHGTAVLMLGTAMGVGFVGGKEHYRLIGEGAAISMLQADDSFTRSR